MKPQTITIDGTRYNLTGMLRIKCSHRERGGTSLRGAWYGPRSRRLIVETYSIWQDRSNPGCVRGTIYEVYEPGSPEYDAAIQYCEESGGEFPDDVPVTTISET